LPGAPPQAHALIRPPGGANAGAASGSSKGAAGASAVVGAASGGEKVSVGAAAARKAFDSSLQGAVRKAGVDAGREPSLLAPVGGSGHVSGVNSRVDAERRWVTTKRCEEVVTRGVTRTLPLI
jgi:hypothetical protein